MCKKRAAKNYTERAVWGVGLRILALSGVGVSGCRMKRKGTASRS